MTSLKNARQSNLRIYSVVKVRLSMVDSNNQGSAVNHDGNRQTPITAPSSVAQAEAIQKAIQISGVDPTHVQYIEAHGTGTLLFLKDFLI